MSGYNLEMSVSPQANAFVTSSGCLVSNQASAHLSILRNISTSTSNLSLVEYKAAQAAAISIRHLCKDDQASRGLLREATLLMRGLVERRRTTVCDEKSANRKLKARIVRAIEAAAVSADPQRFRHHVEGCKTFWRQIGGTGGDNRQVTQAYQAAVAAYKQALR